MYPPRRCHVQGLRLETRADVSPRQIFAWHGVPHATFSNCERVVCCNELTEFPKQTCCKFARILGGLDAPSPNSNRKVSTHITTALYRAKYPLMPPCKPTQPRKAASPSIYYCASACTFREPRQFAGSRLQPPCSQAEPPGVRSLGAHCAFGIGMRRLIKPETAARTLNLSMPFASHLRQSGSLLPSSLQAN